MRFLLKNITFYKLNIIFNEWKVKAATFIITDACDNICCAWKKVFQLSELKITKMYKVIGLYRIRRKAYFIGTQTSYIVSYPYLHGSYLQVRTSGSALFKTNNSSSSLSLSLNKFKINTGFITVAHLTKIRYGFPVLCG